ncbi:uncharacterized protein LOC129908790 [Episyrphus balteatus]|uniref:uncharacterized protein LOC129908790 n=1 Tax=Episyrphus balteatus TaxID=286459 RepID=UPI002485DA78|nr:uncharacterized protein LOC129908790 [Episyrphus balteatus]
MKMITLRKNIDFVVKTCYKNFARNVLTGTKSGREVLFEKQKSETEKCKAELWRKHEKILYFGTLKVRLPSEIDPLSRKVDIERKRETWRMNYKMFYYKPLEQETPNNADNILPFQFFRGNIDKSHSYNI